MKTVQMPDIPSPSDADWKYYLSFATPNLYFEEVAKGLREENRFFADFRFLKLLKWYIDEYFSYDNERSRDLKEGDTLYRARIYHAEEDTQTKPSAFRGYGPKDSFVPPDSIRISNGRTNVAGIPCLYTATSIVTAIAEVTPDFDSKVSVAEIGVKAPIRIFNACATASGTTGEDTPIIAWRRNLKLAFTRVFNRPYIHASDYVICQYICEALKNMGYEGIAFRSAKVSVNSGSNKGINYSIFNYGKCEPVSSDIFSIEDIKYKLAKIVNGFYEPFKG